MAAAQTAASPPPVQPVANPCPRFAQSAQVQEPPALTSSGGQLVASFSFQTTVDAQGRTLYCFMTPDGLQNPTLHVKGGDTLLLTITNNTPQSIDPPMPLAPPNCNATWMSASSVNLHYHGTNTLPNCGGDEVIKTVINSGQTFLYTINFPTDQPPGLYWYHPHIHGVADPVVMGGATGALVVDGIESLQPGVAGLPQRTLVVRDQRQYQSVGEAGGTCVIGVPFRDVSVNYVPVNSYAASQQVAFFIPGNLTVPVGEQELWRVGNTSADSILDLQLIYDGQVQPLWIAAIDGVPLNSQDGTGTGSLQKQYNFRLPPASRVEFVVTTPGASVQSAQLVTNNINTGPAGDCDPRRPLIKIAAVAGTASAAKLAARPLPPGGGRRFARRAGTGTPTPRTVYFSENGENFFMTVDGQIPVPFSPDMPPGIVTTQDAVEVWTVQNRSQENHEFHIHQIHFQVISQNNFGSHPQAPGIAGQYLDTIEVPAWDGVSPNYPSVTLGLDFAGAVQGSFVFHCHILGHEDNGMMNIIQVGPPGRATKPVAAAARPSAPVTATPAAHTH
jgi:FtsP/CotA-like multicopper oxidase with cupredoxin domain